MAYAGPIPFPVLEGGSGDASFTAYAPLCGGTTTTGALQSASSGISNSGYVLTSTGSSSLPTWQAASGGSGITTLNGDTGSATGSTVTVLTGVGSGLLAGATVSFSAGGAFLQLNMSDSSNNTFIGKSTGTTTLSGGTNTAVGSSCMRSLTSGTLNNGMGDGVLQSCTSGGSNNGIGHQTLNTLTTGGFNNTLGDNALSNLASGSYNVGIGSSAGINCVGSESSNIFILNSGVSSTSNTIRIGTQGTGNGQQNKCYIAGIQGASYPASPTPLITYCDTSTGQMVAPTPPASSTATSTFGSLVVGTARQNTANYAILVNISMVITAATSATIVLGVGSTSSPSTNTVVASFSVAETVSFSAFVPSKYYLLVNTTGTITVGSITTQACAVG